MGVKVSALVPTVTDTVPVGDETVTVTFSKVDDTPEFYEEMSALRVSEQWAIYLNKVLVKWDVEQEDGTPYPTDTESLRRLSVDLLRTIGRHIMDHDLGKGLSLNGSSPEA